MKSKAELLAEGTADFTVPDWIDALRHSQPKLTGPAAAVNAQLLSAFEELAAGGRPVVAFEAADAEERAFAEPIISALRRAGATVLEAIVH